MVNESLKAYLLQKVEIDEETVDKLLNWSEEAPELSESQSNGILEALDKMKVLDPACGSGAFPMGILQKTALVLEKIDPQSINWIVKMVEKIPDSNIRKFVEDQLQKEDWSYVHKLGIIQKSIYGVDIQPIAVEISKLRFFLSLIIDCKIDDKEKNRGVKPLPNLETKFVCANSLIGLGKNDFDEYAQFHREISSTQKALFENREAHFLAQTKEKKEEIRKKDKELRITLLNLLIENHLVDKVRNILMLAEWDPYEHNVAASFFDAEWMFGVKNFDIVIGNPPYGVSLKGNYRNDVLKSLGKVPDYEIYYYFIEVAKKLLGSYGFISYIIPNTWLFNTLAKNYRLSVLKDWDIKEILDCSKFKIFDSADVKNSIILFQKTIVADNIVMYRPTGVACSFKSLISEDRLSTTKDSLKDMNQNWGLAFRLHPEIVALIKKIQRNSAELQSLFSEISQGLIAYDKYKGQDEKTIKNRAYHHSDYKEGYKKWLWGEDVRRYETVWNGKEYIDYCSGIANPRQPKFFKGKRLLIREITNPSIFANIVTSEMYNDPSILIVLDNPDYSIELVLGILNSKLATFYHFNHSPKATKGSFPKILIEDIKLFPLSVATSEQQKPIINLVDKILAAKAADHNADTSADEHKIDLLVYHLYGLTFEEAKVIDPEVKEEEFEAVK